MPNDNVKDMINSLAGGDNVKAQDAFKNALSDKIGQALDDKRQTVATDWLNAGNELEATQDAAQLSGNNAEVETPEPVEVDQGGEENADDVPAVQD
jgi:hypothetical protein